MRLFDFITDVIYRADKSRYPMQYAWGILMVVRSFIIGRNKNKVLYAD